MPLDKGGLSSALKDLFEGKPAFPKDETEAGQKWAQSYRRYAAKASAGPTQPLATALDTAETSLASALTGAFTAAKAAGPTGIATLAPLMDVAFVAFWMGPPPMAFAPPAPTVAGVVATALPGVLTGLFTTAFAAGIAPGANVTVAQQADAIATVLDAWTKTVTVVNTPPGPPPVPLT